MFLLNSFKKYNCLDKIVGFCLYVRFITGVQVSRAHAPIGDAIAALSSVRRTARRGRGRGRGTAESMMPIEHWPPKMDSGKILKSSLPHKTLFCGRVFIGICLEVLKQKIMKTLVLYHLIFSTPDCVRLLSASLAPPLSAARSAVDHAGRTAERTARISGRSTDEGARGKGGDGATGASWACCLCLWTISEQTAWIGSL